MYAHNMRALGRILETAGITRENICRDLVWSHLSSVRHRYRPITLAARRGMIVAVWRWAFEEGLVSQPPKCPAIRVPREPVPAWSRRDVSTLVKRSAAAEGNFFPSGCPRALWFECFLRTGYETGLRRGDLFALRRTGIRSGAVCVTAGKTRQVVVRPVSERTLELLTRLGEISPDGRLFGWAISTTQMHREFRRIRKAAGIADGSIQWLRRSAATHLEARMPGSATRFLGHANPLLAARFYIDFSQLTESVPVPPPLEEVP
jgi:integrase